MLATASFGSYSNSYTSVWNMTFYQTENNSRDAMFLCKKFAHIWMCFRCPSWLITFHSLLSLVIVCLKKRISHNNLLVDSAEDPWIFSRGVRLRKMQLLGNFLWQRRWHLYPSFSSLWTHSRCPLSFSISLSLSLSLTACLFLFPQNVQLLHSKSRLPDIIIPIGWWWI